MSTAVNVDNLSIDQPTEPNITVVIDSICQSKSNESTSTESTLESSKEDATKYRSIESILIKSKKHHQSANLKSVDQSKTSGIFNTNLLGPHLIFHSRSDDKLSRDADSVCTARSAVKVCDRPEKTAPLWKNPKFRENWRMFLAAIGLLLLGLVLIIGGVVVAVIPETGIQSYVFFIAGIICFIPGAYHVFYALLAMKGRKGYDFNRLPLFN